MLFSILIPVYNSALYIEQCIKSIKNQSYKNFECIIVNDGSTDNSGNICDEYAEKDDRIIVIHKENGGVTKEFLIHVINCWKCQTVNILYGWILMIL